MIMKSGADSETKLAMESLLHYASTVDSPKQLREATTLADRTELLLL